MRVGRVTRDLPPDPPHQAGPVYQEPQGHPPGHRRVGFHPDPEVLPAAAPAAHSGEPRNASPPASTRPPDSSSSSDSGSGTGSSSSSSSSASEGGDPPTEEPRPLPEPKRARTTAASPGSASTLTPVEELPATPGRVRRQTEEFQGQGGASSTLWATPEDQDQPTASTYWAFSHSRNSWVESDLSPLAATGGPRSPSRL